MSEPEENPPSGSQDRSVEEAIEESMEQRMRRYRAEAEAAAETGEGKRELAAALREVLDELPGAGGSDELHREEAARMRAFAAELRAQPPAAPAGEAVFTGMESFHDRSPLVGLANPIAPPAVLETIPEEKCVRGTCTFSRAHEGAPGLVHGGFLAALLDEALGVVTVFSGLPGMTGEYTVRYHAPTRIKTPLRIEARFERCEGRKITVSADLWDGETRTVSATGTFISVDGAKFAAFAAARSDHVDG